MSRSVLHIAPWTRTTGGVETLLAEHARKDPQLGFDAHQVGLFDRPPGVGAQSTRLGFKWSSTPATMRRDLCAVGAARPGSIVVHHGAWGVPWLADVDGAARRIIFLHASFHRYAPILPTLLPWADGFACDAESTAQEVRRIWAVQDGARVATLPQPIFPPANLTLERPSRREWIVGYIGRLVREEKAAHRLVDFVREARRLGVSFRLEILGDGPLRGWLERQLPGDPAVKFLGWLHGADYWHVPQSWDCVLSVSEREGGPISLLEAMATGVIPIYPAIGGSLGDDYVPRVDPRCYYPAGNIAAAVRTLQALQAETPTRLGAMRQRAAAAVQAHVNGRYAEAFAALANGVAELPRLSRPGDGRRKARLTDRLPLGLLTRFLPGSLDR